MMQEAEVQLNSQPHGKVYEWVFHEKQTQCLELLEQPHVNRMLYGGAKGGGKTVCGVRWTYLMAEAIIDYFGIEEQQFPILVGFMGRLHGTDFKNTTLETWKEQIPSECYTIKMSSSTSGEIIIRNRVKINFSGMDKSEKVKKFNSAEYVFFFLDQAEEIPRNLVGELEASLRRKINGQDATGFYKGLYTANPAQCWLKQAFITNRQPGDEFVQALPSDNPFLKKGYTEQLRRIYKNRPEMIAAYEQGLWDAFDGADQVIKEVWYRNALLRTLAPSKVKRFISVDPAGFGDDETVIYVWENASIVEAEIFGQKKGLYIGNKVHGLVNKWGANMVGVDGIGEGCGTVETLRALANGAYEVIDIQSAGKPSDPMFGNLRAEMWWKTAERMADGECMLKEDDERLMIELTTPTYKYVRGKYFVESKEELREADRLGHSPNRADAFVYGLGYLYDLAVPLEDARLQRKPLRSYLSRMRSTVSAMSA